MPGYSIDQAFLRFLKDVPSWQPDVVILAFPLADFRRTVAVYPFIHSPHWDIPFSKPRIVRDGDGNALRTLNIPTIPPHEIFAARSIGDLPFLDYDAHYRPRYWQRPGIADASYAKRLLLDAWADPGPEPGPHGSQEELVRLHGAIFREFIRVAGRNGATPLIVYFAGRKELLRPNGGPTAGQRLMGEIGVPFVDTTPCVLAAGADKAYLPNDPHYSAAGNAAIAHCLKGDLDRLLAGRGRPQGASMPP